MQIQVRWKRKVQPPQESQEFLMAVAWHTFAHHCPLQNIQRRKQGRGAVALVVVCHRSASALLHR